MNKNLKCDVFITYKSHNSVSPSCSSKDGVDHTISLEHSRQSNNSLSVSGHKPILHQEPEIAKNNTCLDK